MTVKEKATERSKAFLEADYETVASDANLFRIGITLKYD